jgi:Putative Actinobacterial Holin-X, holin superfamily III
MATTTVEPTPDLDTAERESQTTLALVRQLLDELTLLFRQEVRLATAEASRSLGSLLTGVTSFAVAGAVLFAGLLVLLAAAVLGLALVLPAWGAALVVGAAVILIGVGLLGAGRAKVRSTNVKAAAERTAASLREDKDVLTRRATR